MTIKQVSHLVLEKDRELNLGCNINAQEDLEQKLQTDLMSQKQ